MRCYSYCIPHNLISKLYFVFRQAHWITVFLMLNHNCQLDQCFVPIAILHDTGILDVNNWYRKQCQTNRNCVLKKQTIKQTFNDYIQIGQILKWRWWKLRYVMMMMAWVASVKGKEITFAFTGDLPAPSHRPATLAFSMLTNTDFNLT